MDGHQNTIIYRTANRQASVALYAKMGSWYTEKSIANRIKKSELPRSKCFHNGIILIVIC